MFESVVDRIRGLDPAAVPFTEAAQVWRELDRLERTVAGAKLALAGRVEDSHVWRRDGHRSAADYLAHMSGTSVGQARGVLEASRQLAKQPVLEEAVRAGEVSTPQAMAIAEVVAVAPPAAPDLLRAAEKQSLRELREQCARTKSAALPDADARYAVIHQARFCRQRTLADGAAELHYRSTPDEVAQVWTVVQGYADRAFKQATKNGVQESSDAYAADGLLLMAKAARGNTTEKPVDTKIVVRVDWDALVRGMPVDGEVCEIAGIGPVPVSVVRTMIESGDAFLAAVVTKGVDVVNVAHLGRRASAHQQTALHWRDLVCSREGCGRRAHTQIDHRLDWARTKVTLLPWLDPLCPHDHRLKTNSGWALVEGTGTRPMVPPDHPQHPGAGRSVAAARAGPSG